MPGFYAFAPGRTAPNVATCEACEVHRAGAMTNSRRYGYGNGSGWLLITVLSCACLAACGDNDHDEDDVSGSGDQAADTAITDGQAMGTDLANQAEAQLGPESPAIRTAHLGMILLALDQGEIDQAETELQLGTD